MVGNNKWEKPFKKKHLTSEQSSGSVDCQKKIIRKSLPIGRFVEALFLWFAATFYHCASGEVRISPASPMRGGRFAYPMSAHICTYTLTMLGSGSKHHIFIFGFNCRFSGWEFTAKEVIMSALLARPYSIHFQIVLHLRFNLALLKLDVCFYTWDRSEGRSCQGS